MMDRSIFIVGFMSNHMTFRQLDIKGWEITRGWEGNN